MSQINPILSAIESIRGNSIMPNIMNTIKAARDPIAAVQQMAQTDPRMRQVNDVIQQNGGIQQAVYALAKQKGIDPNTVLQQAQQMMSSYR